MSSHDEHGHEKEPIIITSPRRLGKGLAVMVIAIAVGAAILIPNFNAMYKNPPPVTQLQLSQPAPAPAAEAGTTIVAILQGASVQGNPAYKPDPASVPVSNKLVWQNQDNVPHTATSGTSASDPNVGKIFDTGIINGGEKSKAIALTNAKAGDSISYHCTIHPYMQGKITVTAAQAGGGGQAGNASGGGGATPSGPTIKILQGASAQGSQPFDPPELTAKKTDTVQVINQDSVPHTVTNGKDQNDPNVGKLWDTSIIEGGKTAQISLSKVSPGEYDYHCSLHPYMQGKLRVQ
jgi:plastocyanin